MNTISSSLFDTVALGQRTAYPAIPAAVTKAAAKRKVDSVPAMPVSLWRHTQNENAVESRHQVTVRRTLGTLAVLGLGSTAYALWQTGVLMSGSHLYDAVRAFLH